MIHRKATESAGVPEELRFASRGTLLKPRQTAADALDGLKDGMTILVGGFGSAGLPSALIEAVLNRGTRGLTVISNNAGYDQEGVASLIASRRVDRLVCSYPLTQGSTAFREAYRAGQIALELVPQGTLAERIRCGGAGIGGFLSPIGTVGAFAEGKPRMVLDGIEFVVERPLRADFALIRAKQADGIGNLTYHLSGRNFNPVMATAGDVVVAEVDEIVTAGSIDPEAVDTPGIFVDRLVALRPERQMQ